MASHAAHYAKKGEKKKILVGMVSVLLFHEESSRCKLLNLKKKMKSGVLTFFISYVILRICQFFFFSE